MRGSPLGRSWIHSKPGKYSNFQGTLAEGTAITPKMLTIAVQKEDTAALGDK